MAFSLYELRALTDQLLERAQMVEPKAHKVISSLIDAKKEIQALIDRREEEAEWDRRSRLVRNPVSGEGFEIQRRDLPQEPLINCD